MIPSKKLRCNQCKDLDCNLKECKMKKVDELTKNGLNYGEDHLHKLLMNTIMYNYSVWYNKVKSNT